MTQSNDNIIDRDALQEAYIESIIDGMDHKSMYQFVYDSLNNNLDDYTVEELITEVEDYYPELLEEDPLANISELEATADDYGVGK
jgi:hypothetical protein